MLKVYFSSLRVDGIHRSPFPETEDTTPYGRSGVMTHKNIVLRQLISNVAGELDYNKILTPNELCSLHKLLSSSVEPFERQDELRHCPRQILNSTNADSPYSRLPRPRNPSVHHRRPGANFTVIAPNLSRCPIETGVVFDGNGLSIHPGRIVFENGKNVIFQSYLVWDVWDTIYLKSSFRGSLKMTVM